MTPEQIEYALERPTPQDRDSEEAVASISTGSIGLDCILGAHGWPVNRVSRIYGDAMVGKSTLALASIAEAQRAGMTVALVDFHNHFNPDYAAVCGVKTEELVYLTCSALNILRCEIPVDLVVFDGISSQHQADEMGQYRRTGQTYLVVAQALCDHSGGLVVPTVPNSAVSVRLRAGRGVQGGITTVASVFHDDFANPWLPVPSAEFKVRYGQGIDLFDELLSIGLKFGVVEVTGGTWYHFGVGLPVQGRAEAVTALRRLPGICGKIMAAAKKDWTPVR